MPEPVGGGQRYMPGLDGLRAIAVLAVIAYHLQVPFAPGGLLGVGVFFTLSGYLITDLLLGQWARTGGLHLADFWMRRARRLLPALFVMLAVVAVWVALLDQAQLAGLRPAVAAAAGYVSNWWLIAEHSSYFARFGPPSALGHLWSLAVEEQFYLIWPWLLLLALHWGPKGKHSRYWLAAGTLLLAAISASEMGLLYHPGYDPTRIYDGTDTRAFAVMIGAALAFVWRSRELRADISTRNRRLLDGTGTAGLVVIMLLIWRVGQYSPFLYPRGMVLLSLGTAAVVAACASPASRLGPRLGWAPLRWLGVRSYGIYLWHYPIIVLTTPANGSESVVRGCLQLVASILVAALSWRFVEEPIRRGAIGRLWARLRSGGWRNLGRQGRTVAAIGAAAVVLAGCGLAGVVPAASRGTPVAPPTALTGPPPSTVSSSPSPSASAGGAGSTTAVAAGPQLRTSCRSVVHIGDSTSDGLVLPAYQPDAALRIAAQYRRVGVKNFIPEVSGARSIVETYENFPNGATVAQQLTRRGYRGCWVLALGTNDTADVAVGSAVGLAARIREMMSLIGNYPVMWVNVISLLSSGPYSESNMQLWNRALLQACPRYPNMRVYNWAAVARKNWFISDGIHYTPHGYAERSISIANALARAFPAGQPSGLLHLPPQMRLMQPVIHPSCLVN